MKLVAGADVAKGRWVAVILEDGRFKEAFIEKWTPPERASSHLALNLPECRRRSKRACVRANAANVRQSQKVVSNDQLAHTITFVTSVNQVSAM